MNKIADYKLASGSNDGALGLQVRSLLKEGWQLYGDPFIDSKGHFWQALIK